MEAADPRARASGRWAAELELANELAEIADRIAMRHFARDPETSVKQDGTLVTAADHQIEQELRRRIHAEFEGHAVLGEENGLDGDPSGPVWVIDPIDGTNNFAAGIPVFGTLIGLRVDGVTEMGVVSAPALGERYEAATGHGARMNSEPIRVSDVGSVAESVVCTGSYRRMIRHGWGKQFAVLVTECRRDRGFGDFWGYMLVARGAADAMFEPDLKIWDVAALEPILREAGGRTGDFDGGPYRESGIATPARASSFVASNGRLHDDLVARLR